MIFVGIIEANRNVVYEITQYFLGFEDYSLLFICSSVKEYKSLPASKRNKAGIIIIDPGQHNFDRLWQIKYLKRVNPETRILLLSENAITDQFGDKLKKAGVDSVLNKKAFSKDLTELFEIGSPITKNGYNGHTATADAIATQQIEKKIPLTTREFEIVELIVKGHTNKQIGGLLYISPYTVNAHLRKIYVKLSVTSRTALINHIINELV